MRFWPTLMMHHLGMQQKDLHKCKDLHKGSATGRRTYTTKCKDLHKCTTNRRIVFNKAHVIGMCSPFCIYAWVCMWKALLNGMCSPFYNSILARIHRTAGGRNYTRADTKHKHSCKLSQAQA